MKKLTNTEAELIKSVAFKKSVELYKTTAHENKKDRELLKSNTN